MKMELTGKFSKMLVKRQGIENFRFHDLRHTFASWIVMKSKDIYAVQKLLNHSFLGNDQKVCTPHGRLLKASS